MEVPLEGHGVIAPLSLARKTELIYYMIQGGLVLRIPIDSLMLANSFFSLTCYPWVVAQLSK